MIDRPMGNATTGREIGNLWWWDCPASSSATPLTYRSKAWENPCRPESALLIFSEGASSENGKILKTSEVRLMARKGSWKNCWKPCTMRKILRRWRIWPRRSLPFLRRTRGTVHARRSDRGCRGVGRVHGKSRRGSSAPRGEKPRRRGTFSLSD